MTQISKTRLLTHTLLCLLLLSACGGGSDSPTASSGELSAEATEYLNAALDIMQENSINRFEIDWPSLRADVFEYTRSRGGAQTKGDTYGAIRYALSKLGDGGHSRFITPSEANTPGMGLESGNRPSGAQIDDDIGYLMIPPFACSESTACSRFTDQLQELIVEIDSRNICGWIVDVRTNTGGYMWPMVAGVGPVLGDGVAGAAVYPDGKRMEWYYRDGEAGLIEAGNQFPVTTVSPAYELQQPWPPVAVLTGYDTTSSGEAVVVSFRGRPDSRSFGLPTKGKSTGNGGFRLSDGAFIALTVAKFADRTGRVYGFRIDPDEYVQGFDESSPDDPVVQAAIEWLRTLCR